MRTTDMTHVLLSQSVRGPRHTAEECWMTRRPLNSQKAEAEHCQERQALRTRHVQFPHKWDGQGEYYKIREDVSCRIDIPTFEMSA